MTFSTSPATESDPFDGGMGQWDESDDQNLLAYRAWQRDLILPWVGPRVLEVGAGHGMMAELISGGPQVRRYLALEPSTARFQALAARRSIRPSLEAQCATLDMLDSSLLRTFDSAISIHVMEHVEDDAAFLRQVAAFVRPGGAVIIMVPALPWLYSNLDRRVGHYRRYTRERMRLLGRGIGLTVVRNRYDNLPGVVGWWWICRVCGVDYHSRAAKTTLLRGFNFFSKFVLPVVSRIERYVPPPLGLNLTTIYRVPDGD